MDITSFYLLIASYLSREPKPSLGAPIGLLFGTQGCLIGKGGYKNALVAKKKVLEIPTLSSLDSFVPALLRALLAPLISLTGNSSCGLIQTTSQHKGEYVA